MLQRSEAVVQAIDLLRDVAELEEIITNMVFIYAGNVLEKLQHKQDLNNTTNDNEGAMKNVNE